MTLTPTMIGDPVKYIAALVLTSHDNEITPELIQASFKVNCAATMTTLPKRLQTEQILLDCLTSCVSEPAHCNIIEMMAGLPKKLRTPAVCKLAVSIRGETLKSVPIKYRTKELCTIAVSKVGSAFRSVPKNLKTYDVCLAAVTNYGGVLGEVPIELRTYEMCTAATNSYHQFDMFPTDIIDEALCIRSVIQFGGRLRYLPTHLHTSAVCIAAITHCGNYYMRDTLRALANKSPELWMELIKLSEFALACVYKPSEEMVSLHKMLWVL